MPGPVLDPHQAVVERLLETVLKGPGKLDPRIRQAAAAGTGLPTELAAYVQKVQKSSYKVIDRDIEALKAAGYSEDQILELTLSAALGEGIGLLRAGLKAIQHATANS